MRSRKLAAVLLVLSLLLMLVPVQAFAEEETPAETAAESVTGEQEDLSMDGVDNEHDADDTLLQKADEEAAEISAAEETDADEVTETLSEKQEAETDPADAADSADIEITEEDPETASEETEQKEAGLEEEPDADAPITQMTFADTSSEVSWSDGASGTGAGGVRTVTFHASIPEGTTASELNLNVLGTPNLAALGFTPVPGTTIQYIVDVTDSTGSYQFKEGSGAVALADGTWNVSASVSGSLAKSTKLSADGSSYHTADAYLASAGEGNGFSSVLQSQWVSGQTEQELSYYQQMDSSAYGAGYPVVQFKLTRIEAAGSGPESEEDTPEEADTLSGTVPLTVKKVLTGQTLKADQFTFELKDENGNVLQTKKNALDGTIPFDSLQFTGDDLGEHKYTINEVMPEGAKADSNGKIVVDNIEYDTHTETVTIVLSLNEEGKLKATVRQSTTELTFTNKYTGTSSAASTTSRKSPATGDGTPIMPYISMLAGAGLALMMAKRLIRVYVRR